MATTFIMKSCSRLSLCLALLLQGCCINPGNIFKAKFKKTEHAIVPITDISELAIDAEVGSITVHGTKTSDCDITAEITVKALTKEKARSLAEEVKIETETSSNKLTIRVRKPGSLSGRNIEVDFTIKAPMQLRINASTHVGSINVSNIQGPIVASTNVGSITCTQIFGELDLESNVGSIEVQYADDAPAACNAVVTTNVGSIEFVGPAELSAELNASTNVGSIETDQPLTVVGKIGKSVSGIIGSADGKIRLKTNVGSIKIK
jgi:hypothetical protein